MTIEETGIMLALLTTTYTERLMPKIDEQAIKVWQSLLADIPNSSVRKVIAAWVITNKYPPTIADIREKLVPEINNGISADEAWSKVYYAISHFGLYNKDLAEEYLGETWKLVGAEWRYYCTMLEEDVPNEKSRFVRMYGAWHKKEKERLQIPESLRKGIEESKQKLINSGEIERGKL